ncbi:phosphoribosylanthranilate isomerase [Candidatus Desulfovibrio trichonymphae]|uniref:N-(5'-phosphoribosyl)anthranilate isomerase n=1 Tax=Candidatus Desulfovibrio trichonymphae TaxID=1725232 RepID=A0A1J1DQC8_9BACT|nr:phosphoribosylanthranilate isomerase [Candidatus Desulfovibrio trichonymphae]BAV92033.1 N-(5'-phosphoribosyl)anthranilate isomerase [Candidatus Desulfovibrio trichonymphae]GHU98451.1 N-(5'-phosphoribosyl)anthranilate isomerase [Deltaproteobacteria bacterium]
MLIKICGITRQEDIDIASQLNVRFCGFIFHPQSRRWVTPVQAAALRSDSMLRVGVFVKQQAEEILRVMDMACLDFAQLHGEQSVECALAVGAQRVIRVVRPDRHCHRALLHKALQQYAASCAMYLLDAGLFGGGSGNCLEWQDLSGLRAPHPWMLAGGLNAVNVHNALSRCKPDGVDFNSSIEDAPGVKNAAKMRAAVYAALTYSDGGDGV